MKTLFKIMLAATIFVVAVSIAGKSTAQSRDGVQFGAYYFGGWTSPKDYHLAKKLTDTFPERKPRWGWVSSRPDVMQAQINLAHNAGLSFFSFDWYYSGANKMTTELYNTDLQLYLNTPNKNGIKFNLCVCNHEGYRINPGDWNAVVNYWVSLFKNPNYIRANNKPLLTFFDFPNLEKAFGTSENLHRALDSLRSVARANGLSGVSIAACVSPDPTSVARAKACGVDVFTAYNYPVIGWSISALSRSVNDLLAANKKIWDRFLNFGLPYVPVATLDWDPRPWRKTNDAIEYYTGYSDASIRDNVLALRAWVDAHPGNATREKLVMLYAWNELGEGGYLVPTQTFDPLVGLKAGIDQ